MIQTVSTTDSTAAAAAMKQSIGMNKDDFLKLFVTQLQNQDPLNPMDSTEYISQLAQLTQVEQAYNTNTNLANILNALGASSALSAVSFLGSEITAASSEIALTAGQDAKIQVTVPENAQQLLVSILDANGATVRTLVQGQTSAGDVVVTWDGKDASGNQMSSGAYSVAVTGTDAAGSTFACDTAIRGPVSKVGFTGTYPVLNVGGVEVPLGNLLSVGG